MTSSARSVGFATAMAIFVTPACRRESARHDVSVPPASVPATTPALAPSPAPVVAGLAPKATTTAERIALVEDGLRGSVLFAGRDNRHSIAERVAALRVPVPSIPRCPYP